ncbi:hypothetical protein DDJ45_10240 [Mycobacteroides abscessus]|nr:hypothetical protein DDJ45_10240 [Mycobacteroides abscessus]
MPPEQRRVFYIKENMFWMEYKGGNRTLKAFRPNLKYANIFLVPEQTMQSTLDQPGDYLGSETGTEHISPETVEKRTRWLRQICLGMAQGDSGAAGRLINEQNNKAKRFPTREEVRDGSWQPDDLWFYYCDKRGALLIGQDGKPLRPFGTDVVMGQCQTKLDEQEYASNFYDWERAVSGIGVPSVTAVAPEYTFMIHPSPENPNGKPMSLAASIYHERGGHGAHALLGCIVEPEWVINVHLPYPYEDVNVPLQMEELIATGDSRFDFSYDLDKMVKRMNRGRGRVVSDVESDASIPRARQIALRNFDLVTRGAAEINIRSALFLNEGSFTSDMLTCSKDAGGYFGMSEEEAHKYRRDNYYDQAFDKQTVNGQDEYSISIFRVADPGDYPELRLTKVKNSCGKATLRRVANMRLGSVSETD